MLARQLLQLGIALKEYDSRIEQLFTQHKDASIWESFPGAGPTLAPRLCCAFGNERSRYQRALAIQQYSGIAPVIERSGKNQHWVHRRWGRPHFVHQSFFEYASQSVLHCSWAKVFIQDQIARGKLILPRSAPSPLNGSASCSSVGATDSLTMKQST